MDKPIHKIDFIKYSPSSLATINNSNSNISIIFPRDEDKKQTKFPKGN